MISIGEWFYKFQSRPLTFVFCLFVLVWVTLAVANYTIVKERQSQAAERTAHLLAQTIRFNDLIMTESLLAGMSREMGAKSSEICKNGKQLHSLDSYLSNCSARSSIVYNVVEHNIPGNEGMILIVTFDMLNSMRWVALVLIIGMLLLGSCLILFRRLRAHFERDIFRPLFSHLLSDEKISISELNNLRSEIKRAQNISVENERFKAEFNLASQVAHDIRSPLSTLNLLVPSLIAPTIDHKAVLASALSRINSIAESLLDRNRKNNSTNFSQELVAVAKEKDIQLNFLGKGELECNVDHNFNISPDIPSDEALRVISNIINNSIESISSQGKIWVSAKTYQNVSEIIVRDTGIGISKENIKYLFKKGFSSGKATGTGLGLHNAKEVVEKYGGSIFVESDLGKGAVFKIHFPL